MPSWSAVEAYEAGFEQGQKGACRRREQQAGSLPLLRKEFDVAVAQVIHCAALRDHDQLLAAGRRLADANVALRDAGATTMLGR